MQSFPKRSFDKVLQRLYPLVATNGDVMHGVICHFFAISCLWGNGVRYSQQPLADLLCDCSEGGLPTCLLTVHMRRKTNNLTYKLEVVSDPRHIAKF